MTERRFSIPEIVETIRFKEIVKEAFRSVEERAPAHLKRRWTRAIQKAVFEIRENGVWMHWFLDSKSLLIWNQSSNHIHATNGVCDCDCEAYKFGVPCFHRAAARLVRLYFESIESEQTSFAAGANPQAAKRPRARVRNIPPPSGFIRYVDSMSLDLLTPGELAERM